MKLNQLENIDNNNDLNEAPLSFLKKTGLGIKSKFGNRTARGELKSGNKANELYNDYLEFVGQFKNTFKTNKPTTDSLLAFLDQKGLDKREFAQLIDKEVQASQPQQQQEPEKQEPTIDEPQAEPKAQSSTDPNNPLKMGNKSNIKTPGDIGNLDSDKSIPGSTKTIMPTQASNAEKTATGAATQSIPSMAPKKPGVRPQGGGKVKGQLSQTPGAIKKRNARAKAGSQLQLMSMYNEDVQRYRKNFDRIDWTLKEDVEYFDALKFMGIMEAELSKDVVSKILGVAAEKVTANAPKTPQEPQADTQEPQQSQGTAPDADAEEKPKDNRGIFKKAVQGFKAGFNDPEDPNPQMDQDRDKASGEIKGSLNYQKISKEFPGVDPVLLRRSFSKSLQGKELTRQEINIMSQAMAELLKKDPAQTVKVMNLFKQAREV